MESRRELLLNLLRSNPREWNVQELSEKLEVSPITIRRDLDKLEKSSVIRRTYGGCIAVVTSMIESEYHSRAAKGFNLKRAIGIAATREVKNGMRLLIADSTTTFHVVTHSSHLESLTVYTNSLAIIPELRRLPSVDIYVLGGRYHPDLQYLSGGMTEQLLESLEFDIVFLGADAIDRDGRCLVTDQEVARISEVMLRRGRKKILLADHTKVEAQGYVSYAGLEDLDLWITTSGIEENLLNSYRKQTDVIIAPEKR